MKHSLMQMIAALDRLVNYFIPPDIMADREARVRAHVFLISHILGPFIGSVVPGTIFFLDPSPGYEVAILTTSIMSFWLFPFLLRAGVPYNPLALVSIQNLIFCILWSCYFYGGVTSPTLAWVLTIPLLAFFYLDSSARLRMIVIGIFAVNLTIFAGCLYGYHPIKSDLPVDAMQGLGLISAVDTQEDVSEQDALLAGALASGSLTADARVAFGQAAGRQQDDTLLYQELFTAPELKTYSATMNALAPAALPSALIPSLSARSNRTIVSTRAGAMPRSRASCT